MFNPEDVIDFQIKVPAYPVAKTFGAGRFKDTLSGLGCNNNIRSEVLHIRVVYRKIEQS